MSNIPQKPSQYENNFIIDEEEEISEKPFDAREIISENLKKLPLQSREPALKILEKLGEDGVTEIVMNGIDSVFIKKEGQRFYLNDVKFKNVDIYHQVINEVILAISKTNGRVGAQPNLIEGRLEMPDPLDRNNNIYARVHILAPPSVPVAKVTIAKKSRYKLSVDNLRQSGAMSPPMAEFIKTLAKSKVNVIFSGLSGSGKTTLLEAMSQHFDPSDRIVVVEETPELSLDLEDVVYLPAHSYKPGDKAEEMVTMEWLAMQANRMRPDRIIIGEVRGVEVEQFIHAANSGADGSITTIHASSPRQALDKISSLILKASGDNRSEFSTLRDIASTIQIIVQTGIIDGKHYITKIEEVSNTIRKESNAIASATLFEYDRERDVFNPVNSPSEDLISYMQLRGVPLDIRLFQRK